MEKKIFPRIILKKSSTYLMTLALLLLGLCWGIYLYINGVTITGPFIFGDELAYFTFTKSIFHRDSLTLHTQYGPLFPLLISPLLNFANIFHVYHGIRLLNILIFISASIPAFLLANRIFKNKYLIILLPLCVLVTPYSGLVYLVWAEPLYIALFYWVCFMLYKHIKESTYTNTVLLSFFISALYYTKPAAGLVAVIASFLTLLIHCFIEKKSQSSKTTTLNMMVIVISLLFISPWMMHYHYLHVSMVGYPAVTGGFLERFQHDGYQSIVSEILRGLFYQFSYFVVGSFGLINVAIAFFLLRWKNLNTGERIIMLFSLLSVFGLIAISAIGMTSMPGLNFKMAQGRYFSLLLPLLITMALHLIFKTASNNLNIAGIIGILILLTSIPMIASPFYTRSPLVFNSMPEIAPYLYVMDQGQVVWRATISNPTVFLKIGMPLIFLIFTTLLVLFRQKPYAPFIASLIIFALMSFSAWSEIYYIAILGESQAGLNNIYRYLKKRDINITQVAFDKAMETGNVQFLTPFWTGQLPRYVEVIDTGNLSTRSEADYLVVCAKKLALPIIFSSFGCNLYQFSSQHDHP